MAVAAVTTSCTIYTLYNTHTHTICPPDVVNGQTAEEGYFWVSYWAQGITLLRGSEKIFFFFKNRELKVSYTLLPPAVCSGNCSSAQQTQSKVSCPVLLFRICRSDSLRDVSIICIETLARQPFVSRDHSCTELRGRKRRPFSSQTLQNHHNKTLNTDWSTASRRRSEVVG